MRFNQRRPGNDLPEVNLVPMMDVLMTVLTFFIIIAMTLNGEVVNVFLPQVTEPGTAATDSDSAPTLVVGLTTQNEILLHNQPVSQDAMIQEMQAFLQQHPEGIVILKADRELAYKNVSALLKTMRDVGGGRVSLGIEAKPQ